MSIKINNPKPFVLREREWTTPRIRQLYTDRQWRDEILNHPIVYEPKRKNRFIFHFPHHFNIPSWVVHQVNRPSINHEVNTNVEWVQGIGPVRYQWEDIQIALRDPIGPSTTQQVYDRLMENRLLGIREEFLLELLDPVGVVIERWRIFGMIAFVNFGNLDYASDDLAEVTMTIRPDRCILEY